MKSFTSPHPLALALPLFAAVSCGGSAVVDTAARKAAKPEPASYELVDAKLPREATVAELVANVSPTVVSVLVTKRGRAGHATKRRPGKKGPATEGAGSGFIIDEEGYVITNEHVVAHADELAVRLEDQRELEAEVVGRDADLDLALLRLEDAEDLPAARLGRSDGLKVGAHVLAIGNPFGLGHTVTLGIVSAKARSIGAGPYDDFIQTDASINPGNSGGPLFNLRGEVVGINTAIRKGAEGISFAIPIDDLTGVLGQLRDKGYVERGRLGLRFQPVDADLAEALGFDRPRGALVNAVEAGSPADEAGIEVGDVIVEVDGELVDRAVELPRLVARHAPGTEIAVGLRSGSGMQTVVAELGRRPVERVNANHDRPKRPSEALAGLRLEPADGGLQIVAMDAPVGKLEVGDVILSIDGHPVADPSEVREALEAAEDRALIVRVRRDGRELFVGLHP